MKLDYSALNQPVTAADIATFKQSQSHQSQISTQHLYIVIGIIVFILLVFLGVPLLTSSHAVEASSFGFFAVAIFFFVLVGAIAVVAIKIQTKKLAKLYKFTVQNNLMLKTNVSNPGYAGTIFDEGHSRVINQAIAFPDGSEIGNYRYITGSGKNSQTHMWTYAHIRLARELPNMLLDSKKNNLFGAFTNLPNSIKSDQVLSLEGDFDTYFTLYAPAEYKRDALYIFTPDVMAAIIDAGQDYDLEIIGSSLFLYRPQTISIDSESELTKILAILSTIGGELLDQSNNYRDERVGDRAENAVAQQGRQLKHRVSPLLIIFVAVILFITFMPTIISLFSIFIGH